MKKYILTFGLMLLMVGCSNRTAAPEPIKEMAAWESIEASEQQSHFYQSATAAMVKVNTVKKTATATVTMPDLEKYLLGGDAFDRTTHKVEIELPVEQVDGEWQITSFDLLIDYIRRESEQILIEQIESMGGIEINYEPQEVPEE